MAKPFIACHLGDLDQGEALVLDRDTAGTDDDLALFHTATGWWSLNNTCTHAAASLAEGWLEDDMIECPLHSSAFCLRTGAPQGPPASEPAATHRVEIRGNEVWILPGEDVD